MTNPLIDQSYYLLQRPIFKQQEPPIKALCTTPQSTNQLPQPTNQFQTEASLTAKLQWADRFGGLEKKACFIAILLQPAAGMNTVQMKGFRVPVGGLHGKSSWLIQNDETQDSCKYKVTTLLKLGLFHQKCSSFQDKQCNQWQTILYEQHIHKL